MLLLVLFVNISYTNSVAIGRYKNSNIPISVNSNDRKVGFPGLVLAALYVVTLGAVFVAGFAEGWGQADAAGTQRYTGVFPLSENPTDFSKFDTAIN